MAKTRYVRKVAPYIRNGASIKKMMLNVIISLIPVILVAIYHYGFAAVKILLTSTLTMVLVEYIFTRLKKQEETISNLSAVISGLIFGLILPDQTPIYVIVVTAALAMLLTKQMFGGIGNNIFNVAGVARIMVLISFTNQVSYQVDTVAGATALQTYATSGLDAALANYPMLNLFTGMAIPGSIGEASAIAILLGAAWLLYTHAADYKIMLSYIISFSVLALVAGMAMGEGFAYATKFMLFSLLSGGVLFGAVFMATDPVTAPVIETAKVYYGFGMGLLTILIRLFGSLPEGCVFSIVLMNMCVPALEYYQYSNNKFTKRSITIFAIVCVLAMLLVYVGVR